MRLTAEGTRTRTVAMREEAEEMVGRALFALVLVEARLTPQNA
jgi:hypothetical protein